jgi:hypothetical protein
MFSRLFIFRDVGLNHAVLAGQMKVAVSVMAAFMVIVWLADVPV